MSSLRRLALLALAVPAFAAAGCGETVIDSAKTEEQLESELKKQQGVGVKSADCPSDVEVKAGNTFDCTITLADGETQKATLQIRNDDADLTLVNLSVPRGAGSDK
jgi:Domain of unknown function (DUF4333)